PFFSERRRPRVRLLPGGPRLNAPRDVRTITYSGSGTVRGRVRPIGIAPGKSTAAGCRRADVRSLQRGEIALIQRGTCFLRQKALNAQARGAVAALIPNDGVLGTDTIRGTLGAPGIRIPVLALSTAAGRRVASAGRVAVSTQTTSEGRRTTNVLAEAG